MVMYFFQMNESAGRIVLVVIVNFEPYFWSNHNHR